MYYCKHCGNVITKLDDSGVNVYCCGEKMEALVANTKDASLEKHVPVVKVSGDVVNVEVGSIKHPMTEEHYISFIYVVTENEVLVKKLKRNEDPVFSFKTSSKINEVYAYCNLHGLWKITL